jgi:phage shock protein PspC (stress-responsive transcriptional regulator)
MASDRRGGKNGDMNEQNTADPQTGLEKVFAALRGIGVRRRTDDKWIGGVCSGFADRLGVDPVIVRAAFVLLAIFGGVGVSIYLVAWALLPNDQDQIAAERALVHGDGGSVVLVVLAVLAVFGGSLWGHGSGWGFPWGLVFTGLLIWWLVKLSRNRPDADQRVSAQQSGTPYAGTPYAAGPPPTAAGRWPTRPVPSPAALRPVSPRTLRRRSGGPLMAVLAIGLALVTYGSLSWLSTEFSWPGDHVAIAMAGSLGAMGLLLVGLGLSGWRAGFVAFLAVVLAITALSSTVTTGIQAGGRVGDETWAPTSVTTGANYHLGAGNAVLDLRRLPSEGLSGARLPVSVGLGDLKVLVPQGLTVEVVGHVSLGEILLPADAGNNGQGGTDLTRTAVIGTGPTEVVVDAGVGVGQLTVVKEN